MFLDSTFYIMAANKTDYPDNSNAINLVSS